MSCSTMDNYSSDDLFETVHFRPVVPAKIVNLKQTQLVRNILESSKNVLVTIQSSLRCLDKSDHHFYTRSKEVKDHFLF